ncbi:MAG: hypothetical protein A2X46_13460 [Lentisphaerae bacterium GWF2_57_35]|nr:MAG: hypothetical protein A2X46_13460 [Lentisphaerae bacterium GWF2_57_35]
MKKTKNRSFLFMHERISRLKRMGDGALLCVVLLGIQMGMCWPTFAASASMSKIEALLVLSQKIEDDLVTNKSFFMDETLDAYLSSVTSNLITHATGTVENVRVRVIPKEYPYACSYPHGLILIDASLLALMKNEAQLAAILSREVAHLVSRHPLVYADKESGLLNNSASTNKADVLWKALAIDGYAKNVEAEADRDGFAMMKAAGYDMRESIEAFQLLLFKAMGSPSHFFYNKKLSLLPTLQYYYRSISTNNSLAEGITRTQEYRDATQNATVEDVRMRMLRHNYIDVKDVLDEVVQFNPSNALAHALLGEFYRLCGPGPNHLDVAIAQYAESIILNPTNASVYLELGLLLRQTGKYAESKLVLKKYLELKPEAPDVSIVRGYVDEAAPSK